MTDTVANFFIDASPDGVRRIYGYPPAGIDSITTTLRKEVGTEEAGSHKVL
jgi:hypothetical protein